MLPITLNLEKVPFCMEASVELDLPEDEGALAALLSRANGGETEAQYLMGAFYEREAERKIAYIRDQIPSGSPNLRAPLNIFERDNRGIAQDEWNEARLWYEKASKGGHADALYALSCIYSQGLGMRAHLEKGRALLAEAAERGSLLAQYDLGMLYFHGYGMSDETTGYIKQNYEEAVRWLHMAAAQGDALALYYLGVCAEAGNGTEKSAEKAFSLYRASAERDCLWAKTALGRCYEEGIGTEKDLEQAILRYERAADDGDADAAEALERLGIE